MELVLRNARAADTGTGGVPSGLTTAGSGGIVSSVYYYPEGATTGTIVIEKLNEYQSYYLVMEGRNDDREPWTAMRWNFNENNAPGNTDLFGAILTKANEANHLGASQATINATSSLAGEEGIKVSQTITFTPERQVRVRIVYANPDATPVTQVTGGIAGLNFYPRLALDGSPLTRIENVGAGFEPAGATGGIAGGLDLTPTIPYDNNLNPLGFNGAIGSVLKTRPSMTLHLPKGFPPTGGWPVVVLFNASGLLASGPEASTSTNVLALEYLKAGMAVAVTNHVGVNSAYRPGSEPPTVTSPLAYLAKKQAKTLDEDWKLQHEAVHAIQHIRHIAPQYDLNPEFVFVAGRSGGGYPCYWLAALPDQRDLNSPDPQRRQSSRPRGVIAQIAPLSWPAFAFVPGGVTAGWAILPNIDFSAPATSALDVNPNVYVGSSPGSFLFDEARNPGVRGRIARTPFCLLATHAGTIGSSSGTVVTDGRFFNLPLGPFPITAADYDTNPGAESFDQADGTLAPGLFAVLDQPHAAWEQIQLMYMLRSQSRRDNIRIQDAKGNAKYFHDEKSRLYYWNNTANAGDDLGAANWTKPFNVDQVYGTVTSLAGHFEASVQWIRETDPEVPIESPVGFEGAFNVWLG